MRPSSRIFPSLANMSLIGVSRIFCETFVGIIGARGLDRLEEVHRRRVIGRLAHVGHQTDAREVPLREGARLVVHVPVPGVGELKAARRVEPERMDVVDPEQQRGELLLLGDPKLGRTLDCVGRVGTRRGDADDLRAFEACACSR